MAQLQGVLGLVLVVIAGILLAVAFVLGGTIALAVAAACSAAFLFAVVVVLAFAVFLARRRFRSARFAH